MKCSFAVINKYKLLSSSAPSKVGYIANLHNVAYQAEDDLIAPFMTEAQSEFNLFREKTTKAGQNVAFATICGDFNFDNMSPGLYFLPFLILLDLPVKPTEPSPTN